MILLVDNYDSFTYNLYDYLLQLNADCRVIRNDAMSLQAMIEMQPQAIVFSPGPQTPAEAGMLTEMVAHFQDKVPLLGICLGHQAIGTFFGARLVKANTPMHGKTSVVRHNDHPVFGRLPATFEVMRYHSLILSGLEQTELAVIAATESGEPMAIAHPRLPVIGFQFHPESVLTEGGLSLLRNWLHINGFGH